MKFDLFGLRRSDRKVTMRRVRPNYGVENLRFLRKPFQIVRANFRAYLTINAIVYGSFIAGLVAALA
jgi:hypothetical protein